MQTRKLTRKSRNPSRTAKRRAATAPVAPVRNDLALSPPSSPGVIKKEGDTPIIKGTSK